MLLWYYKEEYYLIIIFKYDVFHPHYLYLKAPHNLLRLNRKGNTYMKYFLGYVSLSLQCYYCQHARFIPKYLRLFKMSKTQINRHNLIIMLSKG